MGVYVLEEFSCLDDFGADVFDVAEVAEGGVEFLVFVVLLQVGFGGVF
jgi:hypothetical protein